MVRFSLFVALATLTLSAQALAAGGAPAAPASPADSTPSQTSNPYDAETQRRLQNLIQLNRKRDTALTPEEQAKQTAQDKQDATAIATALQLSCTIEDATLVSAGKIRTNGTEVLAKTYEVACSNGMGYFIMSQDPAPPTGFSCFAAEGQREAQEAKAQKFEDTCKLPANADIKAMATKVLAGAGLTCTVGKLQWFGLSTTTKKDYTEIACTDGRGYLLATPIPGSPGHPTFADCSQAAARGLKCALTATAELPSPQGTDDKPTVAMFNAALAQHNVTCTYTAMRVVGRENVRKRHVVEYLCPEHPKGLVAFIPLGSNTAPFEAVDCTTAAKRSIICTLNSTK